jgi:ABC-type polysaccharide/polyol phosphate export permease
MTFISRARRPAATMWAEGRYGLDAFIEFVNLEKQLIVRQVALQSNGDLVKAFTLSIRTYVVILAHAWFYMLITRAMPGSISYLDFNTGAFGVWLLFTQMIHRGAPTFVHLPSNIPLRIRWINLFLADVVWISMKIILAMVACYVTFILFPWPALTGEIKAPADIPLFLGLFLIAAMLGAGWGLLLQAAKTALPVLDAVMETIIWFMFISSGLYDTYSQLPQIVRPIFQLNPVMTVVEYSRVVLHPGYPIGDLNLAYPVVVACVMIALGLMINHRLRRVEVP